MAAIGGLTFFSVMGPPDLPGMEVQEIKRPSVDGVAFRRVGRRARPFVLTAKVDLAAAANVLNSMQAQKALQGTVVGFTDDLGNDYSFFLVRFVDVLQPQRVKMASGGLLSPGFASYWLVSKFELQYYLGS